MARKSTNWKPVYVQEADTPEGRAAAAHKLIDDLLAQGRVIDLVEVEFQMLQIPSNDMPHRKKFAGPHAEVRIKLFDPMWKLPEDMRKIVPWDGIAPSEKVAKE